MSPVGLPTTAMHGSISSSKSPWVSRPTAMHSEIYPFTEIGYNFNKS